jgi:ribosome modulation factor
MPKHLIPGPEYEAGRQARHHGKSRSSCPYTKGAKAASPQRREWLRGYDAETQAERNFKQYDGETATQRRARIGAQLTNTNLIEEMVVNALPGDEIPDSLPTPGTPPATA